MAEKIKLFFRKKKLDTKFSRAGKGHKLSEPTNSLKLEDKTEPVKRVEPTDEAKIAGQAALARFEAKSNNLTRFNSSYAAIRARVTKELELEKKNHEEFQEVKEPTLVENNSILAAAGVYFRCSIISNEILTRDEWKLKIKEFLYDQLKDEEPGLTACLIIHNCNQGKDKITACIETLGKYLDNIIKNPDVEKYRKIRLCNRIFQEKVLPMEGSLEFLKAAGFEKKTIPVDGQETTEDYLIWNSTDTQLETLEILSEALQSAEPIPIELDRNIQVLSPSQANQRNELPPSFFTISLEELKREQQLRAEAIEKSQMLRTKAMREKDEKRELRRYKYTLIRIKFPDNIILQGTFSVHEKFKNVVEFVQEHLLRQEKEFVLSTPLGEHLINDYYDKTLLELKLIPAGLLLFAHGLGFATDTSVGYLKEETLQYLQTV